MIKRCSVCKIEKPYSEYHRSKITKDGYGYRCIKCDRLARVKYREENRERFLQNSRRTNWKVRFGMTEEDYKNLLEAQGGCCAICGTENPNGPESKSLKTRNFSVDHCHETGRIRGLLCTCCNRGLGLLGDTASAIEKALRYLKNEEIIPENLA